MENIIVVLDFDGTIASGERAKIKYSKEFFGLKVDNHHITRDTYPLGREKYEQLMKYVTTEGIMEFKLEKGVRKFLGKLYSDGFRFAIVTSRFEIADRLELSACIKFCKYHGIPVD
jgi:histidinol phosphatase-like enzyme